MSALLPRALLFLSCGLGPAAGSLAQDSAPLPVPQEPGQGTADGRSEGSGAGGEQQAPGPSSAENPAAGQPADQTAPPPATGVLPQVTEPPTPAPEAPARPAVPWPLDADALDRHMRDIAARHAGIAVLQTIGRSAGGREILALVLTDPVGGPAQTKPALLVVDHQPTPGGAEAAVELAWATCERFNVDERVRALLAESTLLIVPALDPDARATPSLPRVVFDRNFPIGWQPESLRPGAGRISLSQPETLATARYLSKLEHVALIVGVAAPQGSSGIYAGADLPLEDREVFQRLCAALEVSGLPPVLPWYELGSTGGGLFDFAYQALGMLPLALPPPSEEQLAPESRAAWVASTVERSLACLPLLPRVRISQEGLEKLANDLWQLDVRISNSGLLPTLSVLARRREQQRDVSLGLGGAKLVATAQRPSASASYLDASFHATDAAALSCGTLAGGEDRWLRLILEAGSGTQLELTGDSGWAGSARLRVTLP